MNTLLNGFYKENKGNNFNKHIQSVVCKDVPYFIRSPN